MARPTSDIRANRLDAYRQHALHKKRKQFFVMLVALLLFIAFCLLAFIRIWQRRPEPRFMFLTEDWLVEELSTEALIIRDETVYSAPVSGVFVSNVPQGSKVAKAAPLGQVVPVDDREQLRKLDKANNDISDRRYELLAQGAGGDSQRIFAVSEEDMRRNLHVLYDYLLQKDYYRIAEVEMDLRLIMQQRQEDSESYDFNDEELDRLISVRDGLEASAFDNIRTISAEASGVFIRQVDGLERQLNPELATTINAQELSNYLAQVKAAQAVEEVEAGDPLYKLTRSSSQYFVAMLPLSYRSASEDFAVGDRLRIYCSANGVTIKDAELIRQEAGAQGNLVVFRSRQNIEAFAGMRKAPLSLFVNEDYGWRVPKTALIAYQEGNLDAKLKIVDGGFVKEIPVKITASNDQYALIESPEDAEIKLKLASMILLNPDSMEEGEAIGDTQE